MRPILVNALALFLLLFHATLTLAQQAEAPTQSAAEPTRSIENTVAEILSAAPEGTRFGIVVQNREGDEILTIAADERFIPASNT